MMRCLVFVVLVIAYASCGPQPHFCDTNDCSFGSENSEKGRNILADRFVNLYDTSKVLTDGSYAALEIDFDRGGLHFIAKIAEDNIRYKYKTRDTCIWKDPCVEFFFDPGADGLDYYEMQFNAAPQVWDLKLKSSKGPINAPDNMLAWDIGSNWGILKRAGTANDSTDVDKFWSVVGAIPWSHISEAKPKTGDVWAYNFMIVAYDENDNPTYWVAKSTGKEMIHYPELWPTIEF